MTDSDARVRHAYDAVAADYEAAFRDELDHKPLDRALLDAFVELAGEGTVADLGCGPGHVTRRLAGAVSVEGVEYPSRRAHLLARR